MRILSFDIGIKNLAYSLLDIQCSEETITPHIIDWGIVDLIKDTREKCTCDRPECSNRASKRIGTGDKKMLFCKNKGCTGWVLNEWSIRYPKSRAKPTKFIAKKATSYSLIGIAQSIREWLQRKQGDWGKSEIPIDRILLEHQPVYRNPVMKSVEMILVGVLVGSRFHSGIEFVHAKKKVEHEETYAGRKKTAVAMMDVYVDSFSPEVSKVWSEAKKKDDLADTVMQATAWYESKKKPIHF